MDRTHVCFSHAARGLFALALAACSSDTSGARAKAPADSGANLASGDAGVVSHVALPGAAPGIGFDDLQFAPHLGKILAPGGRTGNLDLVDPETEDVSPIGGFSTSDQYAGGHDFGTTSAVEGPGGFLLVTDRTTNQLHAVDPAAKAIVSSVSLAAHPDYVRWVAAKSEAWVTEPDVGQLEVIAVSQDTPPSLSSVTTFAVAGGPESLVIDATRQRAYTNSFGGSTFSIDLGARSILETWKNGCTISLGLALDEVRGFAFVGCPEGKAVALDVANGGATLATATTDGGVDIIAYGEKTGHLYVPSPDQKTLTIVGVSKSGALTILGIVEGAGAGVTADDRSQAWVTDPANGALIRVRDGYAPSK